MTRQELVDKCLDRISTIDDLLKEKNDEFDFYQKLFDGVTSNKVSEYVNLNQGDLLLAYYNAISDKYSLEKARKNLNLLIDIVNSVDFDKLWEFYAMVVRHADNNYINRNISSIDLDAVNMSFVERFMITKACAIKGIEIGDPNDLYRVIKVFVEDLENICQAMNFIFAIKAYVQNKDEISAVVEGEFSSVLNNKKLKKMKSKITKDTFASKEILSDINEISRYKNRILSDERKRQRALFREQQSYNDFIKKLDFDFKRDEITDYESMIKKIPDEEIRLLFLKMVYQHNLAKYEEVEATFEEFNENTYLKFISLLKENGISREEINFSRLMKHSCEWATIALKVLNDMKLSKSTIIKALEKGETDLIFYIKELNDKGVLSSETIDTYSNVLTADSKELKSLQKNLKAFEETNINPANLINNPEVLINNELLETNLEILKSYNLISSIKPKSNYGYLADSNLCRKIDLFLELGFEEYLVSDLALLNEKNLDRLYVLKSIGYPINSKEELYDVLRTTSFIIADSKIADYVPNMSKFYLQDDVSLELEDLYNYSDSERVYKINGVCLSKNRVNRNYQQGLSVFQSLLTGSVLNVDDIENIKNEIDIKVL